MEAETAFQSLKGPARKRTFRLAQNVPLSFTELNSERSKRLSSVLAIVWTWIQSTWNQFQMRFASTTRRWTQIVTKVRLYATLIPTSPTRTTSTTLRTWSSSGGSSASTGAMRPKALSSGTLSTPRWRRVCRRATSFKSCNDSAISRSTWMALCSRLFPTRVKRLKHWPTMLRFRAISRSS